MVTRRSSGSRHMSVRFTSRHDILGHREAAFRTPGLAAVAVACQRKAAPPDRHLDAGLQASPAASFVLARADLGRSHVTLRRGLLPRQLKLQVPSLPVLPRCPDGRPCGDGNARGERDQGDDHGGLDRAMRTALLRSASSYVKTRTSARVGGPVLRSDSGRCHLGRRYGPWRCEIATLS
jgi:hypothetical protein